MNTLAALAKISKIGCVPRAPDKLRGMAVPPSFRSRWAGVFWAPPAAYLFHFFAAFLGMRFQTSVANTLRDLALGGATAVGLLWPVREVP
jgi:hypothetical protein